MTIRNALNGKLPFALSWWAFVFPVGAMTVLALRLTTLAGLELLGYVSLGLFVLLMIVWLAAALDTLIGLIKGTIIPKPRLEAN